VGLGYLAYRHDEMSALPLWGWIVGFPVGAVIGFVIGLGFALLFRRCFTSPQDTFHAQATSNA